MLLEEGRCSLVADKKGELSLNTKTHSSYAVVSFVLSLVGLALFVAAVITSASNDLDTRPVIVTVGLLEIGAMMCNLSGFVYGIIGETMKDYFKVFSHIGLALNAVLLFAHVYVIIVGF